MSCCRQRFRRGRGRCGTPATMSRMFCALNRVKRPTRTCWMVSAPACRLRKFAETLMYGAASSAV